MMMISNIKYEKMRKTRNDVELKPMFVKHILILYEIFDQKYSIRYLVLFRLQKFETYPLADIVLQGSTTDHHVICYSNVRDKLFQSITNIPLEMANYPLYYRIHFFEQAIITILIKFNNISDTQYNCTLYTQLRQGKLVKCFMSLRFSLHKSGKD